jgi:hypothetical protein
MSKHRNKDMPNNNSICISFEDAIPQSFSQEVPVQIKESSLFKLVKSYF